MVLEHNATGAALNLPATLRLQKVLCWVNSTEKIDWTVQIGRALASNYEGVCHVVMCLECQNHHGNRRDSSRPLQPLTPEKISEAGDALQDLYGNDVLTMVLPGHPIAEVRRYASARKMDLIIVGEQALEVEKSWGERLYEKSPCAVMILVMPGTLQENEEKQPVETDGQNNMRGE